MIEQEVEIKKKREKNKFILSHVYTLPSIPIIMMEVSRLLDNPMTSASELGKVISKDQGLVTKILTVANSPLYGLPRRVSTIDFAIIILGFEHIKSIVIALSMMEAFKNKSDKFLDQKKYWTHSIITASAAKRLTDDLGFHFSGEAFISGLLHDLGIPVIHKYFHTDFIKIIELATTQNISFITAEEEVLGLGHSEIGNILAQRWNLPTNLSDSILNHHNPGNSQNAKTLSAIIHLADYMTCKLSLGNFNWDSEFTLDETIYKILNLGDETYLEKLIHSYKELFIGQLESIKI